MMERDGAGYVFVSMVLETKNPATKLCDPDVSFEATTEREGGTRVNSVSLKHPKRYGQTRSSETPHGADADLVPGDDRYYIGGGN